MILLHGHRSEIEDKVDSHIHPEDNLQSRLLRRNRYSVTVVSSSVQLSMNDTAWLKKYYQQPRLDRCFYTIFHSHIFKKNAFRQHSQIHDHALVCVPLPRSVRHTVGRPAHFHQ